MTVSMCSVCCGGRGAHTRVEMFSLAKIKKREILHAGHATTTIVLRKLESFCFS